MTPGARVTVRTSHWNPRQHARQGVVYSTSTCGTTGRPTCYVRFAEGDGDWVLAEDLEATFGELFAAISRHDQAAKHDMKGHTHPCTHCGQPVACTDDWERNYDGQPEVVCPSFHLPNGEVATVTCDECDYCTSCGQPVGIRGCGCDSTKED